MTSFSTRPVLLVILIVLFQASLKADSIPEVVAKAKPAIVEIVTGDATGTPKTLGTGFFVSPNGLLVTNRHVIEGAGAITAVTNNGAIFLFERIVAQPPGVDLAILKFQATDVPFLKLGESTTAVEGQKVIVIGNPTGLMGTVSDGIISAFRENRSLIQITAPISHGSSGSPVMDETGQVLGIATLVSAEGQNLNFAIAVENVSAALMQLPRELSSSPVLLRATPTPPIDAKVYLNSVGMTTRECLAKYGTPVSVVGHHGYLCFSFRWHEMDLSIFFPSNKGLADSASYKSKERFSDQMIATLLGSYGKIEEVRPDEKIDGPTSANLQRRSWVARKNTKLILRATSNAVFDTAGSYPDHPDYFILLLNKRPILDASDFLPIRVRKRKTARSSESPGGAFLCRCNRSSNSEIFPLTLGPFTMPPLGIVLKRCAGSHRLCNPACVRKPKRDVG